MAGRSFEEAAQVLQAGIPFFLLRFNAKWAWGAQNRDFVLHVLHFYIVFSLSEAFLRRCS